MFKKALAATAEHRASTENIADTEFIINLISNSSDLQDMWVKYQKKFAYAKDISYESIMDVLRGLVQ